MAILALTMGPQLGIAMLPGSLFVGSPGVISFRATGAIGQPLWKLVSDTLPDEWDNALTVNDDIASLSTDEIEVGGTYSITIRCVDESRVPVVMTFTVRMSVLPLTISGSLPEWTQGTPVTGALTISGGTAPYSSLTVTDGAWPDGVTASIVGSQIVPSGTPTTPGPWTATLSVTDSTSASVSYTVSGVVDEVVYTYATWANKSNTATLVDDGLTVKCSSASGGYANARSSITVTKKTYLSFALVYDYVGGGEFIGIGGANSSWLLSDTANWLGYSGSAAAWGKNGSIYPSGTGGTMGTAIEMAIDPATRRIWVRNSGGAWFGGGNPATGTSPTMTVPSGGSLYIATSLSYIYPSPRAITMHSNPASVTGTAPAGYVKGFYS